MLYAPRVIRFIYTGLVLVFFSFWTSAFPVLANVPALVKANKDASLSAFQPGTIKRLHVSLGQRVKAGNLLIEFECELPKLNLQTAQAQAKGTRLTFENNQRLLALGAIGQESLALSEVEAELSAIELARAQLTYERCFIHAPFDGVVQAILSKQYEYVEANTPLVTLLDVSTLKVEFLIPAALLDQKAVNDVVNIIMPDTNRVFEASITHLAPSFDPVSQTRFAEAILSDMNQTQILPGMSVKVAF